MSFLLLDKNFSEEEIDEIVCVWTQDSAAVFLDKEAIKFKASWTYDNAFFFAFHLCSTIGYGNISPRTALGQTLAVFYATIGIPLNTLFLKLIGQSFAESYEETVWKIKGAEESASMKFLGDLGFFVPWTIIFYILPSVIFMFTEEWDFTEGIYYSFITLTTVGLGDYVAGTDIEKMENYVIYRIFIFFWMLYGLAFTSMITDTITHEYQNHLLFVTECKCKEKCTLKFHRVYVDIEKLDIHFRLLRSEGVKHKFSMWAIRKDTQRAVEFQTHHLANLAILAEKVQGELLNRLEEHGSDKLDTFPVRSLEISQSNQKRAEQSVSSVISPDIIPE